jgi:hypothetical protein
METKNIPAALPCSLRTRPQNSTLMSARARSVHPREPHVPKRQIKLLCNQHAREVSFPGRPWMSCTPARLPHLNHSGCMQADFSRVSKKNMGAMFPFPLILYAQRPFAIAQHNCSKIVFTLSQLHQRNAKWCTSSALLDLRSATKTSAASVSRPARIMVASDRPSTHLTPQAPTHGSKLWIASSVPQPQFNHAPLQNPKPQDPKVRQLQGHPLLPSFATRLTPVAPSKDGHEVRGLKQLANFRVCGSRRTWSGIGSTSDNLNPPLSQYFFLDV